MPHVAPPAAPEARTIREIVVALNATPHSDAALETAVYLARLLRTRVRGVFVEDEQVLNAASLPEVREVHSATRRPQRLAETDVQHTWRQAADYVDAMLRDVSRQARVRATLDVVRGSVTRELMRAAEADDLLIIGKCSTHSSRRRLGSTARCLLTESPASVLTVRQPIHSVQPVVVYVDDTDAATTALRLALQAGSDTLDVPVRVLVPSDGPGATDDIRRRIRDLRTPDAPWVQVRALSSLDDQLLSAALRCEKARLVILPDHVAYRLPHSLTDLLHRIDRPTLLVRSPQQTTSDPMPPATASSTLIHLALTPTDAPRVTPLELLEDFADASPGWQYLGPESRHYADEKGVPACVLRHRLSDAVPFVDVAFAAVDADEWSDLELVVLDRPDAEALDAETRNTLVETLLRDLRTYLDERPGHAQLRTETRLSQP